MGRFAAGLVEAEQHLFQRLGRAEAAATHAAMHISEPVTDEPVTDEPESDERDETRMERYQSLFGNSLVSLQRLEEQRMRISDLLSKMSDW